MAYTVMGTVFEVHRDLGRLFDEKIYQHELACRLGNAQCECPVEVVFDTFSKCYFLDLVVDGRAIFELKAVEAIVPRHRAQLMHYLLLADVHHGKLVNLRPDKVEHEFVNTTLTQVDRTSFSIAGDSWDDCPKSGLKDWVIAFLSDIGVGLEVALYEEVAAHYCSCTGSLARIDIRNELGRVIGQQEVRLLAPEIGIQFTAFSPDYLDHFEIHLKRFLQHTTLRYIQWVNLSRPQVQFKTIRR